MKLLDVIINNPFDIVGLLKNFLKNNAWNIIAIIVFVCVLAFLWGTVVSFVK